MTTKIVLIYAPPVYMAPTRGSLSLHGVVDVVVAPSGEVIKSRDDEAILGRTFNLDTKEGVDALYLELTRTALPAQGSAPYDDPAAASAPSSQTSADEKVLKRYLHEARCVVCTLLNKLPTEVRGGVETALNDAGISSSVMEKQFAARGSSISMHSIQRHRKAVRKGVLDK